MKKIGVVVAMKDELDLIFGEYIENCRQIKNTNYVVYELMTDKAIIYIACSGVGEIASSRTTQMLISRYNVDLIYNTGIVGKLHNGYDLLETVVVSSVVHYDFDISQINDTIPGEYSNNGVYWETDKDLTEFTQKAIGVKSAICMSGDKFIADNSVKENFYKKYKGDICEMECAGIVITANFNNVPVVVIKGVSDGEGGAQECENFWQFACMKLKTVTKRLFDEYIKTL